MTHQRGNFAEGSRHMFVQYPDLLPTITQINIQIEKYAVTFWPPKIPASTTIHLTQARTFTLSANVLP